jgi:hypothetical protein
METKQIEPVEDYNLVWPAGFEISDQTAAEIELKKAQARKLQLSWKSVDEVRADEGLDPLPDGNGQVILDSSGSSGLMDRIRDFFKRKEDKEVE